jgi:hypothetical protein
MVYKTSSRPFLEIAARGGQIVLRIRQATEQGYIECDPQGVFDIDYPSSITRRARVTDRGHIAGTIMTGSTSLCVFIEHDL